MSVEETVSEQSFEDELQRLRNRVTRVEDHSRNFLAGRVDELEETLTEERTIRQQLEARVGDLEQQLAVFRGLAEDQRSTPEKRKLDLMAVMIDRAQEKHKADSDVKGVSLHYDEVWDALIDLGHENLHKPQIYRVMEDAAKEDGFEETKKRKGGKDIRAIRVDLDALPADALGNNITTEERVRDTTTDVRSVNEHNVT